MKNFSLSDSFGFSQYAQPGIYELFANVKNVKMLKCNVI